MLIPEVCLQPPPVLLGIAKTCEKPCFELTDWMNRRQKVIEQLGLSDDRAIRIR